MHEVHGWLLPRDLLLTLATYNDCMWYHYRACCSVDAVTSLPDLLGWLLRTITTWVHETGRVACSH